MFTPDQFNQRGAENLPGHLGIIITHVSKSEVRSELAVKTSLMAPNGYLHAGSVVTLADTAGIAAEVGRAARCADADAGVVAGDGAIAIDLAELSLGALRTAAAAVDIRLGAVLDPVGRRRWNRPAIGHGVRAAVRNASGVATGDAAAAAIDPRLGAVLHAVQARGVALRLRRGTVAGRRARRHEDKRTEDDDGPGDKGMGAQHEELLFEAKAMRKSCSPRVACRSQAPCTLPLASSGRGRRSQFHQGQS